MKKQITIAFIYSADLQDKVGDVIGRITIRADF